MEAAARAHVPTSVGSEAEKIYRPGELRDRAGFGPGVMKALNEGFIPLVDECVDMAHERSPELSGVLAIQVEIIGDPELGGVIEKVGFSESNDLVDAELQECVRESAWSLTLPPPEARGKQAMEMTIPVTPEDDG
jgi:hypothetical protein